MTLLLLLLRWFFFPILLQACAVMALERVPADIRKDGGLARMSDPKVSLERRQRRRKKKQAIPFLCSFLS